MANVKVCGRCQFSRDSFISWKGTPFPVDGGPPLVPVAVCGICGEETGIFGVAKVKRSVLKSLRDEAHRRR